MISQVKIDVTLYMSSATWFLAFIDEHRRVFACTISTRYLTRIYPWSLLLISWCCSCALYLASSQPRALNTRSAAVTPVNSIIVGLRAWTTATACYSKCVLHLETVNWDGVTPLLCGRDPDIPRGLSPDISVLANTWSRSRSRSHSNRSRSRPHKVLVSVSYVLEQVRLVISINLQCICISSLLEGVLRATNSLNNNNNDRNRPLSIMFLNK